MIYQAMFDEVDEGTAIFKCTNSPPVGANPFVTFEGLPSDHYLWLTGMGGRLLRGEIEATERPLERASTVMAEFASLAMRAHLALLPSWQFFWCSL
jgi:hypothetical protein